MMTNIKINVIGILCVMFYEDLILIQYYFKIGGRCLTILNIVLWVFPYIFI